MDEKINEKRELQELLAAAQSALDQALDFAKRNKIPCEIDGFRYGPTDSDNGWGVELDHNENLGEDEDPLPLRLQRLDYSSKWVGSWSPGC